MAPLTSRKRPLLILIRMVLPAKFNFFFLGGNNSGSYQWGPTMESAYHVDDFIINGSRIGPTYFQMAGQLLPH